jgi:lysophospholipase L1-like esterase
MTLNVRFDSARRLLVLGVLTALIPLELSARPKSVIRIMCLGDSITAGYTDNPTWTIPFTFSYRIGLYNRMSQAGYAIQFVGESPEPWAGKFGLPQSIGSPDLRLLGQDHHRGYAWMDAITANGALADWMSEDKPDVILLMLGTIDFIVDYSDFAKPALHLKYLIDRIVTTWPRVHVIVAQLTPFPWYNSSVVKYNDYIRTVLVPTHAAQGRRVTTVNLYDKFLRAADSQIDGTLFSKGLHHPNPIGYDRMAEAWFEALKAIYPQTPTTMLQPPSLSSEGHFRAQYKGQPNAIYQIQRARLLPGPWENDFPMITADSNGIFEIDDPHPGPIGERFYRIANPYK